MTRDEMKQVMKYFGTAYRGFYDGTSLTDVLNVWSDAFADERKEVVQQAAKNYVSKNEFPPTIAGVKKQVALIKRENSDSDLWSKIQKAVANGLYGSVEEFNKLPSECQAFVGSPLGLKDLSQIDMGTLNTVVKGQFLKRVEEIRTHQEVQNGLPMEVRLAIEDSKQKMLRDDLIG